ncbi:MAG: twin-arginine translocase subunit TatC [Myxococcota bacterium]
MFFLITLNILSVEFFTKNRRYAIVAIVVFAAVVTPTTDAVTLILLSIPLLFLYELGILFSTIYKRFVK